MKKSRFFELSFIAMLPFLSCVSVVESVVEKTGRALDGSAFAEKKIARFQALVKEGAACDMEILDAQSKSGRRSLIISLKKFPAIKLRGSEPDADGNFTLSSLEYLSGNTAGWNEYSLELFGAGTFRKGNNAAIFSVDGEIEQVQISRGKIRRYDTRVTGGEALVNLRNRGLRVEALTEWMKSRENAPTGQDRQSFEKYWKPVLFPEMCVEKKRPAGWQAEGDVWARAEDIRWNTSYTERIFPEELRPVRNSGTLLRDWEEAFEWIYFQYEWETLIGLLSRETSLKQVK
jgi:hypothetical protein